MADTVNSLTQHLYEVLVDLISRGADAVGTRGLESIVARASTLGPDGAWLVAAGHSSLAGLACARGQVEQAVFRFEAAVAAGYNDCVAVHLEPIRSLLHGDPRFWALYERMRITQADLDELFWLHREMYAMIQEAQQSTVDNIGRRDTGVALLPQAPLPTREPNSPGVLCTRVELAAVQTALRAAAIKADFQRSAENVSLSLIDDTWNYAGARQDAWYADGLDAHRQQAAWAREFVERPGAGTTLGPCPPLGSIAYPA
ncbi:hypothetical protein ACGFZP_21780 [Kitasatospora sp. NPDC048239]|uniref:hypothetical protein n=1 Tax=Kitasatospora sp. NPDC048239 TaxID=3364046 RepID=UPI003716127A